MPVSSRHGAAAIVIALAVGASSGRARAQTPVTVNVAVDATAPGAAIERIWPFHGYDEANYSTTPDGRALLGTLATLHAAPVHVGTHFLLNTGNGVASLKWGSTNIYTEDAGGNRSTASRSSTASWTRSPARERRPTPRLRSCRRR
jgi:xylan 1,4-beta-xylosidase